MVVLIGKKRKRKRVLKNKIIIILLLFWFKFGIGSYAVSFIEKRKGNPNPKKPSSAVARFHHAPSRFLRHFSFVSPSVNRYPYPNPRARSAPRSHNSSRSIALELSNRRSEASLTTVCKPPSADRPRSLESSSLQFVVVSR